MPLLIGNIIGVIYMFLCAIMVQSQVTTHAELMKILPQLGMNQPQGGIGGGFNQPIMQGQGVAVGGYAQAPQQNFESPQVYQQPAPQQGFQQPPMGYQPPAPGY